MPYFGNLAATFVVLASLPVWIGMQARTHALVFDLPVVVEEAWPGYEPPADEDLIRISVNYDGAISWNGETVSLAELENLLEAIKSRPRMPGIIFAPNDDAAYGAIYLALGAIVRADLQYGPFCFDGLARNSAFGDGFSKPVQPTGEWLAEECDPYLAWPILE